MKYERPAGTEVHCSTRPLKLMLMGREITINPDPTIERKFIVQCSLCQSEFHSKWDPKGKPVYTGGLLESRHWHKPSAQWIRRMQACICTAGKRFSDVQPASTETIRAWKRLRAWNDIRTARAIIDAAKPIEAVQP